MAPANEPSIAERLAGKTVLLTGGSGFVGKAIICALLRGAPDIGQLRLLLRAGDDEAARLRLRDEVRAFRTSHGPPNSPTPRCSITSSPRRACTPP